MTNKPQLFLLHFAGGNCYSFKFLKQYLEHTFEFIPLELPGRGRRIGEEMIKEIDLAVNDYLNQIRQKRNRQPFIIYGHSMGAMLGLKVAAKLEKLGDIPLSLIVSGNAGPGTGERKDRHQLPEPDFKAELHKLGGIAPEILNDTELFNFFSPVLRADFEVIEKGRGEFSLDLVLNIPIVALMGDEESTAKDIDNWKRFSTKKVITSILPGNHFFIHTQVQKISNVITGCYNPSLVC